MVVHARMTDMPKNRVERLEEAVAELESTVEGLTGELVEAKQRIRALEGESLDRPASPTDTEEAAPDEVEAAAAEATGSSEDSVDGGTDEIIIA